MRLAVLLPLLCLAALPAAASSSYPGVVREHVPTPSTPSCTLCHQSNAGGGGTATKPFGQALLAEDVGGGDTAGLKDALDALEAAGVDSDGDGDGDVDELRAGTDPNAAGDVDVLRYGFGCGAAPASGALLLLLLPLLLLPRRAR